MASFIPIRYHGRCYPSGIEAQISEVAGHFDKESIEVASVYSLHTEYSYGRRRLSSSLLDRFPTIRTSNNRGVPRLWVNDLWVEEFCNFIVAIVGTNSPPKIIEIHPPFDDYCSSVRDFLGHYGIFESLILSLYPSVQVLIENRCGSTYSGGKFLISTYEDLEVLCQEIETRNLKLGIALDIPQLFTAMGGVERLTETSMQEALSRLAPYRHHIKGIHIWGKRDTEKRKRVAHIGNLDTYFGGDTDSKHCFLSHLHELLDDDVPRFFVPEVNSNDEDLASIVVDLVGAGFVFLSAAEQGIGRKAGRTRPTA